MPDETRPWIVRRADRIDPFVYSTVLINVTLAVSLLVMVLMLAIIVNALVP